MTINCIAIDGNLGREIEISETANGHAKASWSLAHKVYSAGKEETQWFNCQAYGKLVESIQKLNIEKGDYMAINGRISNQSYERDGEKKTYLSIVAQSITVKRKVGQQAAGGGMEQSEAGDDVPF